MENIVVGIADCRVGAAGQSLSTYWLGSCVALAASDASAGVGGLLHYMLPDSALGRLRSQERPCMFADTGMTALLEALERRGAARRRLVVQAAGAARILDAEGVFDIGNQNRQALHRILRAYRIPLVSEACGGTQMRSVRLEIGTGRFVVREGGAETELARASAKGDLACPAAKFVF